MVRAAAVVAAIKSNKCINALSAAALALPGMVPKANAAAPAETASTDFLYSRYRECCNRIDVDAYQASAIVPLGDRSELTFNWVTDVVSGSSPVLNIPESRAEVMSGASGGNARVTLSNDRESTTEEPVEVLSSATIRDLRNALDIKGRYFFDHTDLALGVAVSNERDYRSYSANIGAQSEFNQKMTTLAVNLAYTSDEIEPIDRSIQENKRSVNTSLGITQIWDKASLSTVNFEYIYSSDFLSNPYKKVFVEDGGNQLAGLESTGDADVFFEERPDRRHQYALVADYVRYFPEWDAALHLDYRFHADSWDIKSHTFEASWHQPMAAGWMLTPRVRYYSQNQADFYRPFFRAPRSDGFYSSDYRLSGFGAISAGLTLSKQFFDKLRIEVSFEYYQHKAEFKLGGDTQSDFADFSYSLVTAGIRYEF